MRAADLHRLARTLREIALNATENTGDDRVNAGELAVMEDVAKHPGATIGEITHRTGLAQSLVSRITRAVADAGALVLTTDPTDRRKVRVELDAAVRRAILERADNPATSAIEAATPGLSSAERNELELHLSRAAELLRRADAG
ncbi:MarR family winged helix-turn-helix transcriptional regulator [Microbacterium sp. KR10-403]|uniref:MarR family winged helix-turn-helix transcriptional regulator n=1 Tax=Microbacterium sp. KR10-403 TaxID=3158581 RepID=UPI0032E39354